MPHDDETKRRMQEAQDGPEEDSETRVSCPRCSTNPCPCCRGIGTVTRSQYAECIKRHPNLKRTEPKA